MKRSLFLFALVFVVSCRKGEDDPFLSLRSRDNRLSGTWEIYSMKSESSNGTVYIFEGNLKTRYEDGEIVESYPYNELVTFDKNGEYVLDQTEYGDTYHEKNYWSWQNSDKKKTQLRISGYYVYDVVRLTNSELTLRLNYSSGSNTYTEEIHYLKK